jgi:Helix-turn-helix domain
MSQRGLILRLLREAGPEGVDAHELIYVFGITQPATRVFELREQGHDVETIDRGTTDDGRRRLCTYVLRGAQGSAKPSPVDMGPPAQSIALALPCGCVRAPSGMGWESRCDLHANQLKGNPFASEVTPW